MGPWLGFMSLLDDSQRKVLEPTHFYGVGLKLS
jgi:hypothetical protein